MSQNLSGRIYWTEDTFAYTGTIKATKMIHQAAKIDQVIVEDYMIKFFVLPLTWKENFGATW